MGTEELTTITAKKKILLARAGKQPLPQITQMVFGNGGVNAEGKILKLKEGQESLNGEIYRKDLDKYEIVSDTKITYYCTLLENELAGEEISELTLADSDGDLVAIKNFAAKGKDSDWKMTFKISDVF